MAFVIPLVKNDMDIYKSNKSRKISESSSVASTASARSRKISECRSDCSGPSNGQRAFPKYHSVPDRMSSAANFRVRTSSYSTNNRTKAAPVDKTDMKTDLKRSQSWLNKLKRFMKSKSDDERTKS
ncbi:uncharacterized protein LOC115874873 [Sitophilus oryzae]|uniref:Uncharacterized protein LOC115874873 n=1 Tax=Sitophilus oryzae TaxID=7048 RepID=A0A6J2X4B0_SITOR|nr:uncharacterized protein LOC115874873 [Sitophilus oryzae]